MRAPAVAALGLVLGLFAAACTGQAAPPPPPRTPGPGTAAVSPPPAADTGCGNPAASLRPAGPLPAPGDMPAGSFMRTIQDRGHLVAGVSGDRLLFGSLDPLTNQLEGFEIDLLEQVAKAIFGAEGHVQLRAVAEAQRLAMVRDGTLDVVAGGVQASCAAWRQVDLSTVYYHAVQRVLVARSSAVRGIDDLRGKRVCTAAGSAALASVTAAPSHPVPVAVADWTECLVRFQAGEVDAISADDATLLGFAEQDPYAQVVGDGIGDDPLALAIGQGHPDLVRFANAMLDQMRADGRWAATYARWLGRFGPPPAPPAAQYR